MKARLTAIWELLHSSYWFIPSLMAVGAVALAYGSIQVDDHIRGKVEQRLGWVYAGGPEGARAVLSAIAGSIVTVTATTFSITIAALSLASSQFGPRLLRTFRRDTGNQIVLGTFIATFIYSLLVLRTVRGTEQSTYVPHFSVTVGVALAVLSLGVLIYFIHHMAASIEVSYLINSLSKELETTVRNHFPDLGKEQNRKPSELLGASSAQPAQDHGSVPADQTGYLLNVDYGGLVKIAKDQGSRFRLDWRPGQFIISGAPLLWFDSTRELGPSILNSLHSAFYYGPERSPEQDPEYGFLQIAEIAVRALSPGINDPFTAMSCIDRQAAGLCLLADRTVPSPNHYDSEDKLRMVARVVSYEELVQAAFLHIRIAARQSPAVLEYLRDRIALVISRNIDPILNQALQAEYSQAVPEVNG